MEFLINFIEKKIFIGKKILILSFYLQYRQTRKFYLALVWGNVKEDFIDIRVDIGKDTSEEWSSIKMAPADSPACCDKPRDARTKVIKHEIHFHENYNFLFQLLVLERGLFRNMPATKVLLAPITGRRHQVSIMLLFLNIYSSQTCLL